MLRTNLSTRPFYNERAVHIVAAIVAVVLVAITAWQVVRVRDLSRYKTQLNTAIRRDRNEADVRTREAQSIRSHIDEKQLATLSASAKEANDLIAQRTFSWTQLFNEIETTLPDDVMLMGVHPEIKDGLTELHLDVQGRNEDVIDAFWDRLEKTGRFHDVAWTNVAVTEDGLQRMVMKATYTPGQPSTRPPGTPPAVPAPPAPQGEKR
jgi:hypothetical protein